MSEDEELSLEMVDRVLQSLLVLLLEKGVLTKGELIDKMYEFEQEKFAELTSEGRAKREADGDDK